MTNQTFIDFHFHLCSNSPFLVFTLLLEEDDGNIEEARCFFNLSNSFHNTVHLGGRGDNSSSPKKSQFALLSSFFTAFPPSSSSTSSLRIPFYRRAPPGTAAVLDRDARRHHLFRRPSPSTPPPGVENEG
ncbi:hypothetical protein F3Y22_tig00009055pilonHSYRG00003 [Hibiscus syriacus]|uniref:Uncharacterized protein n=1 Tax=Hibiscus syriacus TaxID=106335 RepID=A0A6A3CCS6_HIBSY|nr:hypothetical protein F3Y22_tig00009055pilonHSYRG00003 [Hibiscus syriacus]